MPGINGVYVELQCQQNLNQGGPIEEFAPRQQESDEPALSFMPKLYDPEKRICSVFIPIFPSAQFNLRYEAKPPTREYSVNKESPSRTPVGKTVKDANDLFYVFKLFIGRDEITTWSCGPEQEFQGKVNFALFDTSSPEIYTDGKGLQKRVFSFQGDMRITGDLSCDKDEDRKIEIRVFRAEKSLRVPRQPEDYNGQGMMQEIRTPYGGMTNGNHSKRFFYFGLVDPLDNPYATLRFYYRSWEQLHKLGLRMGEAKDDQAAAIFEVPGARVVKNPKRHTIHAEPLWTATQIASNTGKQRAQGRQRRVEKPTNSPILRYDPVKGQVLPKQTKVATSGTRYTPQLSQRFSTDNILVTPTKNTAIAQSEIHRSNMETPEKSLELRRDYGSLRLGMVPPTMLLPPKHPHAQRFPMASLRQTHPQNCVSQQLLSPLPKPCLSSIPHRYCSQWPRQYLPSQTQQQNSTLPWNRFSSQFSSLYFPTKHPVPIYYYQAYPAPQQLSQYALTQIQQKNYAAQGNFDSNSPEGPTSDNTDRRLL